MATDIQYMALSQLVGSDLPEYINGVRPTIGMLLDPANNITIKDSENPALDELDNMMSWELVSFQPNTASGFAGAAFQSPEGEIVFAFRGTEPINDGGIIPQPNDGLNDLAIATGQSLVAQYIDAQNFVLETINNAGGVCYNTVEDMFTGIQGDNISFTGHSLGGGLAQYMTYKTADFDSNYNGLESVTFNAVGIGQKMGHVGILDKLTDFMNILTNKPTRVGVTA